MNTIEEWVELILSNTGVADEWVVYVRLAVFIFILIMLSGISYFIAKRIIINYIYRFVKKSSATWDDALADYKVFNYVAHIIPAIFVRIMAPVIFTDFESARPIVVKLTDSYLLIVGVAILFAFLRVGQFGLSSHKAFKDKPLASYFQLTRLILYIVTGILVFSVLLDKSPFFFLSAFGAMTAILLLIFKDTILGLVASVQMSSNDMVRVGDWVEMPKFNADGDVIEINLNTVKVQNWDRTITAIPTYFFITDSFKNWRGMQQSGGRRIKRAIYIDAHTVSFIDPETREELKKTHLIKDFVETRQKEIETFNSEHNLDTSVLINGRRMTNLGVFRKYVEFYLQNHPKIRQDMTVMVRQLAADSHGIPIEIYCFTDTTAWLEYESIQADIFDHLFAAASFFKLDVFQAPGGKDFSKAFQTKTDIKPASD